MKHPLFGSELETRPVQDRNTSDVAVPWLVVATAEHIDRYPLAQGRWVVVGRSLEADVQIAHPTFSRRHLEIEVTQHSEERSTVRLRDLGGRNGTQLNGRRLQPHVPVTLPEGAPIEIGECTLLVHFAEHPQNPAPRKPTKGPLEPVSEEGRSPAMRRIYSLASRIAQSELAILIVGETGVGKEVLARHIHANSLRRKGPFVAINCAALSQGLIESELFGHEEGAFTNAVRAKPGLFEAAKGGTLFLDEVGELPKESQSKLLRVLEEREARRVGSVDSYPVDVRVLSATNQDIDAQIKRQAFREDLAFRLNAMRIEIPPLRDRRDEIVPLASKLTDAAGHHASIDASAQAWLCAQAWPGNIRQLRNTIERACVLANGSSISVAHLDPMSTGAGSEKGERALKTSIGEHERTAILQALDEASGNQSRAARQLGISRKTLYRKLEKYNLSISNRTTEEDSD